MNKYFCTNKKKTHCIKTHVHVCKMRLTFYPEEKSNFEKECPQIQLEVFLYNMFCAIYLCHLVLVIGVDRIYINT